MRTPTALYAKLDVGDPAPLFRQRSSVARDYAFDTAAGRYVVLCFFGSAADRRSKTAIDRVLAQTCFDGQRACFFGVSIDRRDESEGRLPDHGPGVQFIWDFDGAVSRLYGSLPLRSKVTPVAVRRVWMVLAPTLRVIATFPFVDDDHDAVFAFLRRLLHPDSLAAADSPAPVLTVPDVFEPALCNRLIAKYAADGGHDSGVMRERAGQTVHVLDPAQKRRRDCIIDDPELIKDIQTRIVRRINPELMKAFWYKPTRIERYLVACYAAAHGGHFKPHRDNSTAATAHRRFAVSINLNDGFEGGALSFPEYGSRSYNAPVGAAVVFSAALLHAVSPVTAGQRFAFLPFLYDEEAAQIRTAHVDALAAPQAPLPAG